jgi:methoxymalonate biosynthesis acyl carrier protein
MSQAPPSTRGDTPDAALRFDDSFRNDLRAFLQSKLPDLEPDDSCDIFARGLANSLFAMELVLFVERTTGRRIPNEELSLNHFRSIDAMTALAGRLCSPDGGA